MMAGAGGGTARNLLMGLVRRADRAVLDRRISAPAKYDELRDAAAIEDFHRTLTMLERTGAIALTRRRGAKHLVDRVVMIDPDGVAVFLGIDRFEARSTKLIDAIKAACKDWPTFEPLLNSCAARWRRGETAWGLDVDETDKALIRFRLFEALFQGGGNLDRRSFSSYAVSDSKAFERHQSSLCDMVRHHTGIDLEDEPLLEEFGVVRFVPQVLLTGGVFVDLSRLGSEGIIPGTLSPYVSIDESWVGALDWMDRESGVVLTIENLATFNSYVRQFRKRAHCVVYTGGFPSSAVMAVLKRLKYSARRVRFFHWGDMDWSGYEILSFISREVDIPVTPFLMCPAILESIGAKSKNAVRGDLVFCDGGELAVPRRGLSERKLEQEKIPVMSLSV